MRECASRQARVNRKRPGRAQKKQEEVVPWRIKEPGAILSTALKLCTAKFLSWRKAKTVNGSVISKNPQNDCRLM